jgi:hypothetical protein
MASTEQAGTGRVAPEGPVFWNELYWFALLCTCGVALCLWILPPRLARNRSTAEIELDLRGTVEELGNMEREYEAAILAVENDPFYREEVVRAILKVKKKDEVFLKQASGLSDN